MRSVSGHITFADRSASVKEVVEKLPRLAKDIEILALDRQTSKGAKAGGPKMFVQLRCRRNHVRKALQWLIDNSPAYADVELDEENLDLLPEDGQLQVRTVTLDEDDDVDLEHDHGPARV